MYGNETVYYFLCQNVVGFVLQISFPILL